MNKKSILVVISKDNIRRNILDTEFWPTFLEENKETSITVVCEEGKEEYFNTQYGAPNVSFKPYKRIPHTGFGKVVNFLVRIGMYSHSVTLYRNRAYLRGEAPFLQTKFKALISNTVGRVGFCKHFVRKLVLRVAPPKPIKDIFDEVKPDLVFAASLIDNDFDVLIATEAKQRNIRLVGMVRSWDNLNNHGLLAVVPDRFIVQNEWLTEAAERFQAIDMKTLPTDIVGLPHYDPYFAPEALVKKKEDFFKEFGLDPNKKMILLGGSDFYYSEDKLPKIINDAIENGDIKEHVQLVFRPHPASLFEKDDYRLLELPHVVLDDAFSGKVKFSDNEKFINLVYHADIIMNICSTMSIDAAVFKKPAVCINFDDPERNLPYYLQVGRLYDTFDHYEALVATGGASFPESEGELIDTINMYLTSPETNAEGRKKIVERFVAPFDGHSGERLARILTEEVKRVNKKEENE